MSSPLINPFFFTIRLSRSGDTPIYLQLIEQLSLAIKNGILQPKTVLPSSRSFAELLGIHRKTIVRAYDDLIVQGWLESKKGSSTFVAQNLPVLQLSSTVGKQKTAANSFLLAGFHFHTSEHLSRKFTKNDTLYRLDNGYPDPRLAPLHDLSRAYRTQLIIGNSYDRLGYDDPQGSLWLREELALHLRITRAINCEKENILITRGTVMGLYLATIGLISAGDYVVVGTPGWLSGNINFKQAGAVLLEIPVDDYGIDTDELEKLCKKKKVRMVYITSHHHYPTTISLRAQRRIHLLALSAKFGFVIFEDDYDFEFHYLNKPLSPLASSDENGMVLYSGSFSKTISPAFRVGYLVGAANVIEHLSKIRRVIDRQGDTMLDNAVAELLQNGNIQRHLRKSLRVYRQRRDTFCSLLKSELGNILDFDIPEGGMAVWTKFDPTIDMVKAAQMALRKGLYFSDGKIHNSKFESLNATRLGFASSTIQELQHCVDILKSVLR